MADTMTLEELRESLDVGCLPNTDRPRWFAAIDAAIKQREQDAKDAARLEWYFGPSDKKDWLDTYMRGMREGWSVGQWRAAIDSAMAKESGNG